MTFATLRALHGIIGTALDDMERVYRERGPALDFPSVDDPYYATGPHSPEEVLAEVLLIETRRTADGARGAVRRSAAAGRWDETGCAAC